jgi:hypothetical protein
MCGSRAHARRVHVTRTHACCVTRCVVGSSACACCVASSACACVRFVFSAAPARAPCNGACSSWRCCRGTSRAGGLERHEQPKAESDKDPVRCCVRRAPALPSGAPLPCDGMTTMAAPSCSAFAHTTRPTLSASVEKRSTARRTSTCAHAERPRERRSIGRHQNLVRAMSAMPAARLCSQVHSGGGQTQTGRTMPQHAAHPRQVLQQRLQLVHQKTLRRLALQTRRQHGSENTRACVSIQARSRVRLCNGRAQSAAAARQRSNRTRAASAAVTGCSARARSSAASACACTHPQLLSLRVWHRRKHALAAKPERGLQSRVGCRDDVQQKRSVAFEWGGEAKRIARRACGISPPRVDGSRARAWRLGCRREGVLPQRCRRQHVQQECDIAWADPACACAHAG